jgi:hypothetical protein
VRPSTRPVQHVGERHRIDQVFTNRIAASGTSLGNSLPIARQRRRKRIFTRSVTLLMSLPHPIRPRAYVLPKVCKKEPQLLLTIQSSGEGFADPQPPRVAVRPAELLSMPAHDCGRGLQLGPYKRQDFEPSCETQLAAACTSRRLAISLSSKTFEPVCPRRPRKGISEQRGWRRQNGQIESDVNHMLQSADRPRISLVPSGADAERDGQKPCRQPAAYGQVCERGIIYSER